MTELKATTIDIYHCNTFFEAYGQQTTLLAL